MKKQEAVLAFGKKYRESTAWSPVAKCHDGIVFNPGYMTIENLDWIYVECTGEFPYDVCHMTNKTFKSCYGVV